MKTRLIINEMLFDAIYIVTGAGPMHKTATTVRTGVFVFLVFLTCDFVHIILIQFRTMG
jgi:hypothetical protein